jgi:hypothetical protein
MNTLKYIANLIYGKLPICAVAGSVAGVITGLIFGLLLMESPNGLPLDTNNVLLFGAILGMFSWLFLLFLIGVLLRYGIRNIALALFLNAMLTSLLTVYIMNKILNPSISFLVGWIIGTAVGYLMCSICNLKTFK